LLRTMTSRAGRPSMTGVGAQSHGLVSLLPPWSACHLSRQSIIVFSLHIVHMDWVMTLQALHAALESDQAVDIHNSRVSLPKSSTLDMLCTERQSASCFGIDIDDGY
jgi:hypothetical protein